jgi:trk system potassium uptake protein TrkA
MTIDKLEHKTLREIDLTNRHNCQVIAVRKHQEAHYRYIPRADDVLAAGDSIIVIGKSASLEKIIP